MKKNRKTKNFTLTELLIVIAIIAILIGILLPVLNETRETARTLACLNSIRQMGVAMVQYESVFNAFTPVSDEGQPFNTMNWYKNPPFIQILGVSTSRWQKDFWNNKFLCPNIDLIESGRGAKESAAQFVYGITFTDTLYVGDGVPAGNWVVPRMAVASKIRHPSKRFLFQETTQNVGRCASANRDPGKKDGWWEKGESALRVAAYRHKNRKSINSVFFDGHAETNSYSDLVQAKKAVYYNPHDD